MRLPESVIPPKNKYNQKRIDVIFDFEAKWRRFGDVFFGHSKIARRWSLSIKMAVPKFRRNWPGSRAPISHRIYIFRLRKISSFVKDTMYSIKVGRIFPRAVQLNSSILEPKLPFLNPVPAKMRILTYMVRKKSL